MWVANVLTVVIRRLGWASLPSCFAAKVRPWDLSDSMLRRISRASKSPRASRIVSSERARLPVARAFNH
eukprot:6214740-Pleurochrysis_carterae.AAC.5